MAEKRIVIFGWADSVHIQRWVYGLSRRGYHIKLISAGGKELDGIETVILPRTGKWSYLKNASAAIRHAREFRPHLVHAHYAAGFGWWAHKLGFTPTVVSVWGSDIAEMSFPSWLYASGIRKTLRQATHVTATSDFLKRLTLQLTPDVEPRLSVIPFGVRLPEEILPPPEEPPLRLCYLKGHHPRYGAPILLEALRHVTRILPEVHLSIAGEDSHTPHLKKLTQKRGLEKHVTFVGFVRREEINSFLQQHHVMVMPSLAEAFGVAALEAQANRRPVIASDVGGIPEVVKDGKTGILVPPSQPHLLADTIITLAGEPEKRTMLGNAGYEFVKQNYREEKTLDLMSKLYERIIREYSST